MDNHTPDILREAADPTTSQERLAEIAATHPEAQAAIAQNPACYEGLLDWIAQVGDQPAKDAVARVRSGAIPQPPADVPAPPANVPAPPATVPAPPVDVPLPPVEAVPAPPAEAPASVPAPPADVPASPTDVPAPGAPFGAPALPLDAPGAQDTAAQPTAQYTQPVPPSELPTQQLPHLPADATAAQQGMHGHAEQPAQANQFAQPGAGGPVPPYGAPGAAPAASPAPRKRKKGLIIGLIAGALVLLLGGGGLAYALIFSKIGGASSPVAAVEKLFGSVSNVDLLSTYGSLAPSEISAFQSSLDRLQEVEVGEDDKQKELTELLTKITDTVDVKFDGLTFETETIDEGIELVTITDGTLEISGDPDQVTDAVMEFMSLQADSLESSLGEFDEDETRDEVQEFLDDELPFEISVEDISDELGFDPVLMTVKEGGSWFVSPMLTGAEYVYQGTDLISEEDRGTMPSAKDIEKYDSPEAAAEGLTDAVIETFENADVDALVASLPLAERRLVAIYGPPLLAEAEGFPLDASVTPGFTSDIDGDRAELQFEDFSISSDSEYSEFNLSLTGVCAEISSEYSDEEYCLTDKEFDPMSKLGVEEWHLTAVKQDGGWFLSPVATVSDISAIVSAKIAEYSKDGSLEKLFA